MKNKKVVAVIYNRSTQTKFLRKGGVIQVDEKKRRAPKSKMSAKSSRGFVSGTGGFANGFPRKSLAI